MNQIEPRRNPKVFGAILVALGVLFLLGQLVDSEFIRLNFGVIPWPLFQIVPGILVIALGLTLGKNNPAMTIVGMVITVAGFILWFQETTGAFQTWAYAWALVVPTSIGLGFLLHGEVTHQTSFVSRGITMIVVGLVLFGIGFTFFEFTINLSGFGDSVVGRLIGPALLIGLGLYLLVRRGSRQIDEEVKVK